jgi:hypothetical protein
LAARDDQRVVGVDVEIGDREGVLDWARKVGSFL